MTEKIGALRLFLRFCTKLKDVLLPRMSCEMPVKAALHPGLSGAQQPDDERLYSYGVTTNRFFSSYSSLKLPFEDKGQNILNAAITYDPNYHVKMFKISRTRHDRLNKKAKTTCILTSLHRGSSALVSAAEQHIYSIFSYLVHSQKTEPTCSSQRNVRESSQVQRESRS